MFGTCHIGRLKLQIGPSHDKAQEWCSTEPAFATLHGAWDCLPGIYRANRDVQGCFLDLHGLGVF